MASRASQRLSPPPASEDPGIPSAQGERTASGSAHPARLIAELVDGAERPITFPASKLPHESARRLLETMGVTIVDDVLLRRGDERPREPIIARRVREAVDRARARGVPETEIAETVKRWAA